MTCDLYCKPGPKKEENWSIYLTLPDTIPILTSYNVRKNIAVILPISVMDYKSYIWSVLWSSTSIENYSPGLCSSGAKWCSHFVDSGFESRYKKAAMEKTTPASIASHKPLESCKSQFTEQTPSNNCREKQVCSTGKCEVIDSASGKGKSANMNRLYPGEPYLMWSLLSMKWNSIFNDTKLKEAARRRWHPQHCHLQSVAWRAIKVACSLNSLSSSFLTTSLPLCLSPHLSWQVLRFLQSWVFICMWLSSTGTCLWEDTKGEKDQKQYFSSCWLWVESGKSIRIKTLCRVILEALQQAAMAISLQFSPPFLPAYQVCLILRLVIASEQMHSNHPNKIIPENAARCNFMSITLLSYSFHFPFRNVNNKKPEQQQIELSRNRSKTILITLATVSKTKDKR